MSEKFQMMASEDFKSRWYWKIKLQFTECLSLKSFYSLTCKISIYFLFNEFRKWQETPQSYQLIMTRQFHGLKRLTKIPWGHPEDAWEMPRECLASESWWSDESNTCGFLGFPVECTVPDWLLNGKVSKFSDW